MRTSVMPLATKSVLSRTHCGPFAVLFLLLQAVACTPSRPAPVAPEQAGRVVEVGARIRVSYACTAPPSAAERGRSKRCREVGALMSAGTDTLRWSGQGEAVSAVHWESVHEFELSEGQRVNANRVVGFALGFAALGIAAGAGIGCAIQGTDHSEYGCLEGFVAGGALGGILGLSAGLFIGGEPRERWRSLTFPVQVSIVPGGMRSFAVVASVNF